MTIHDEPESENGLERAGEARQLNRGILDEEQGRSSAQQNAQGA